MDTITAEHIERIEGAGYQLGKIVGQEVFVDYLLEDAARLFAADKDDMAKYVRSLAKILKEAIGVARKEYDKSGKKERDESWSILDEAIGDVGYSK